MGWWSRRLAAGFLVLCLQATLAAADTAAGVAAYDKGDYARARTLLMPEAEKGNAKAEYLLGMMYLQRQGGDLEILAARFWLKRSVDHGDPEARKPYDVLTKVLADLFAKGPGRIEGGDGSSQNRALSLPDAKTEADGVRTERAVVHFFFPGWTWQSQALLNGADGKPYDLITLQRGGEKREVYFDLSNWFGHME